VGARQARLRNEYAAWYPTIPVAIWLPAKTVARIVTRQLVEGGPAWALAPRWALGPRVLDSRHFIFRGGVERTTPYVPSRPTDGGGALGQDPEPSGGGPTHDR
jgi:hypothetical protein